VNLTRRQLLGAGAAVSVLGVAAACGGSGAASPATRAVSTGARRTGLTTPRPGSAAGVSAADWARLRDSLTGRLVRPGQPGYLRDVELYDPRFDGARPRGIVYCATADDVARGLAFARAHDLALAARSGGHSYAGYSTSRGLVLDVTSMAGVRVAAGRATVGAGARLIDVYSTLGALGVGLPAGSCPTVGIAGLTLGGGQGVLGRARGLTCDRLREVTLVTADGVTRTVGPGDPTGLFWACQGGGGGNFGVVTSFTFSTFTAPKVALFFLTWPWAAASQVLPAWQSWAPSAPDELWSNCLLLANPAVGSTVPLLRVGGVYQGSAANLSGLLSGLAGKAGSHPVTRFVEEVPFTHAMYVEAGCADLTRDGCHLPTEVAGGQLVRSPVLAKSDYLTRVLPAAGVAAILAAVDDRQHSTSAQGGVAYDSYGGVINRVAPGATAFVHRDTLCCAQYTASFAAGASAATLAGDRAWLDQIHSGQRPYVSGQAYQNYIDPTLADWEQAYYGSNLARLRHVKARYDPDQVFRFAQSIPPA